MPTWILVATVLIPQEFASSAIVFIVALQNHFPIWAINLIWACSTLLDMYVGYMIGVFTRDRWRDTRLGRWVEKLAARMKARLGTHGEKISLSLLAIVNFPYVNAFLGAWIGLPLTSTLLLTLAGNFVWYLFLWATVLGLTSFISDPDMIILILVGAGLLAHFSLRLFKGARRG